MATPCHTSMDRNMVPTFHVRRPTFVTAFPSILWSSWLQFGSCCEAVPMRGRTQVRGILSVNKAVLGCNGLVQSPLRWRWSSAEISNDVGNFPWHQNALWSEVCQLKEHVTTSRESCFETMLIPFHHSQNKAVE
jgi:hypothetical protein